MEVNLNSLVYSKANTEKRFYGTSGISERQSFIAPSSARQLSRENLVNQLESYKLVS